MAPKRPYAAVVSFFSGMCPCECDDKRKCLWNFVVWPCRVWGLITAAGLWGVGIEAAVYKHTIAAYFLVIAVITMFLETVFLMDYWVAVCMSEDSSFMKFWEKVLWLDDWKKALLYAAFSCPCFINLYELPLGIVSGVMLVISFILYLIKTWKSWQDQVSETPEENDTYDRFDDYPDDLECSIINPTSNIPIMTNVADQNEILEV